MIPCVSDHTPFIMPPDTTAAPIMRAIVEAKGGSRTHFRCRRPCCRR